MNISRHSVYLVQHVHKLSDDAEDVKIIGVYESESDAQAAIKRLSMKPGFFDCPEGFEVSCYVVGRDHWIEGFVTR